MLAPTLDTLAFLDTTGTSLPREKLNLTLKLTPLPRSPLAKPTEELSPELTMDMELFLDMELLETVL